MPVRRLMASDHASAALPPPSDQSIRSRGHSLCLAPQSYGRGHQISQRTGPSWQAMRTMAPLAPMPPLALGPALLGPFGRRWAENGSALSRTSPYSSNDLGGEIDQAVAASLSVMLGGIPVVKARGAQRTMLYPPLPDCVETAPVTIVGGIPKAEFRRGLQARRRSIRIRQ